MVFSEKLMREFKDPPKEHTAIPFWFINKIPRKNEIRWQIKEMFEKGVYGFFIHPRLGLEVPDFIKTPPRTMQPIQLWKYFAKERKRKKIPYLTSEWWRIVSDILEEGKKYMMEVGIYDEIDWPSGTAGMTIPRERKFRAKYLLPTGKIIEDDNYIDVMDSKATDKFIEVTHEAYWKRYKELFGKQIKYFFSDEATLLHNFISSQLGWLPWTNKLEEEFRREHGYEPKNNFGLLWKKGKGCERFRCDFWKTVSRLYSENFHGRIKKWCEEHGVRYTGHVLWEEVGPLQIRCQANIFEVLRHMHIPGIDHLGNRMGGCFPRIASSVAHYIGSKRVLCEANGASGWDLTLADIRRIANWLFVNGVNMINPHAFYFSIDGFRKDDAPPSQFFQASYWKDYKRYADYVRRASYVLSQGEHDPDVAVYYPVMSLFANYDTTTSNGTFNAIVNELEYLHVLLGMIHQDYDFADDKMIIDSKIKGKKIQIGRESYKALIIPSATTLSAKVIKRLDDAIEAGVKVIFTTWLPFQCFDEADAEQWSKSLFGLDPKATFKQKLKLKFPLSLCYRSIAEIMKLEGRNSEYALMSFPFPSFTRVFSGKHKCVFLSTNSGLSPRERNAKILERILGKQCDPKINGKNVKYLRIFKRKVKDGKIYFITNISKHKIKAKIDFGKGAKILDFDRGRTKNSPKEVEFPPFESRGFYA